MRALAILLIVLQGSTCVVLVRRGLASRYRAVTAYLAFSMVRGLVLAQFSIYDPRYRDIWIATALVVTVLQIATALEAYRHSLEELPGAQRWTHWVIVGLSIVTASLVQIPQKTHTPYGVLSLAHQAVATMLGVTAICVPALITYLRPRRRRNAVVHERVLALHFTGLAILAGLVHLGLLGWTSVANGLVSITCCLAWLTMLTVDGELTVEGEVMPERPEATASRELGSLRLRLWNLLRGGR